MDLTTLQARQNELRTEADAILRAAENRGWTEADTKAFDDKYHEIESNNKRMVKIKGDLSMQQQIDAMFDGAAPADRHAMVRKSFGAQVIEHKAFKDVIELARRSRRFESDLIEVKAAPVLVDGLVPAESIGPAVPGPTHQLTVAALFSQGQTSSNAVTYNRETSFTNAAGAVAEGTPKPESEIVLTPIVEPVRKYAHWITLSKEALDDIVGIRSFIDGRLRYGLALKIDAALLNGAAAPDVIGILHRAGLSPAVTQGAGESVADAILRQAAATQTASGLPADGVVINPADWMAILAAKDLQGGYYGNGPFAAPAPDGPTLWGTLRVAVSQSIAPKTALVGSFQRGAQLLWREAMTVSMSNSHADYYVRNLIAVLCEARVSEIVTMPESFGIVTLAAVTP